MLLLTRFGWAFGFTMKKAYRKAKSWYQKRNGGTKIASNVA